MPNFSGARVAAAGRARGCTVADGAEGSVELLQRRDMITKHLFAVHLIRDSTVIPNDLPQSEDSAENVAAGLEGDAQRRSLQRVDHNAYVYCTQSGCAR